MTQLAEGLKELWNLSIIHRDIKPENLLLSDKSESPFLKICDLGMSKNTSQDSCGKTRCGTRHYMAPEVLLARTKYSYKVDLWSAGVILYELLIGHRPFEGQSEYSVLEACKTGPRLRGLEVQLSESC